MDENALTRAERATGLRDRILYDLEEEDLTKSSSPLFQQGMKRSLMLLKANGEALYIELMEQWKRDGVKRLPQLDAAIGRMTKSMNKWANKARRVRTIRSASTTSALSMCRIPNGYSGRSTTTIRSLPSPRKTHRTRSSRAAC